MPGDLKDRYNTRLDNKYGYSTVVDIPKEVAEHEPWFNQTLTQVNDAVVRLGILQGEYHWHKHDHEDEFFVVLEGQLLLDLEGQGTVTLDRHLGYTVPKGVVHRTRAPGKTIVLMVEAATVTPPAIEGRHRQALAPERAGVEASERRARRRSSARSRPPLVTAMSWLR